MFDIQLIKTTLANICFEKVIAAQYVNSFGRTQTDERLIDVFYACTHACMHVFLYQLGRAVYNS